MNKIKQINIEFDTINLFKKIIKINANIFFFKKFLQITIN